MLVQTAAGLQYTMFEGLAINESEEYDSKAAGGLGEPVFNLRECKHHGHRSCGLCAEAVNHGGHPARFPTARKTKLTPGKGARFRASWVERQAQTLEKLERRDGKENEMGRLADRRDDRFG